MPAAREEIGLLCGDTRAGLRGGGSIAVSTGVRLNRVFLTATPELSAGVVGAIFLVLGSYVPGVGAGAFGSSGEGDLGRCSAAVRGLATNLRLFGSYTMIVCKLSETTAVGVLSVACERAKWLPCAIFVGCRFLTGAPATELSPACMPDTSWEGKPCELAGRVVGFTFDVSCGPVAPVNHDPLECIFFCTALGLTPGDEIGLEKLTEGEPSSLTLSCTFDRRFELRGVGVAAGALSTLTPRFARGLGDVTRRTGSVLADRWWPPPRTALGIVGTGGASEAAETEPFRPGDGDLNVRSVMDPLLLFRCNPPLPTPPLVLLPITLLLIELCEPRRDMRLVWMLPTGSGEVVCERRAAAAAADDSEAWELLRLRKAELAAVAAAAEVLGSTGCA